MYGFFSLGLVEWMWSREGGETELDRIVAQCSARGYPGVTKTPSFHKHYTTEETHILLEETSNVTGLSQAMLLSRMGDSHLKTLVDRGYLPLIRSLGSTMFELISNLDSFHLNLAKSYPMMRAPSFRPYRTGPTTCDVHYYSSNEGFSPFAIALVCSVAKFLFDMDIEYKQTAERGPNCDHDIFQLTMPESAYETPDVKADRRPSIVSILGSLTLPADATDAAFPWHIAFDRDLNIVSVGTSLADRYDDDLVACKVYQLVRILRPTDIAGFDFEDYFKATQTVDFVVKVLKDRRSRTASASNAATLFRDDTSVLKALDDPCSLYLKGEMLYMAEHDSIVFLGIPSITGIDQMQNLGIVLRDMPIHSNGRELVFGVAAQSATMAEAESLNREAASLQADLAEEKRKAEELLHSILPPAVADLLACGKRPPAETHPAVSVLFSDIVGFTSIASSVHPQYVMDMLNELFSKFDKLCEVHNVYKVETIGDAYMVVSGLPTANPTHADDICGFALDMLRVTSEVMSPLDRKPLQIRIGIHSGSIMAGVVGDLRPRYTLFGDTVNTASRMESTSTASRIQISTPLYQAINNPRRFNLERRGDMNIKGKGSMVTWWLADRESARKVQIASADDEVAVMSDTADDLAGASGEVHQSTTVPSMGCPFRPTRRQTATTDSRPTADRQRLRSDEDYSSASSDDVVEMKKTSRHSPRPSPRLARAARPEGILPSLFEAKVHVFDRTLLLDLLLPSMRLGDITLAAVPGSPNCRWRLFIDKECKRMLVDAMTVGELHQALVVSGVQETADPRLHLYAHPLQKAVSVL